MLGKREGWPILLPVRSNAGIAVSNPAEGIYEHVIRIGSLFYQATIGFHFLSAGIPY
jgi:hypothetical protein